MPTPSAPPLELVARTIEIGVPGLRELFSQAVARAESAVPDVSARRDLETGRVVLAGADESRLEAFVEVLRQDAAVADLLDIGPPRVVYRETLGRRVEIEHAVGAARLKLAFEPAPRGSGFRFESHAIGRGQPAGMVRGVEAGLAVARARGLLAGFPVTDMRATLIAGAGLADEAAFWLAAEEAFGRLREAGEPVLLEPVMSLEVIAADGVDTARLAGDLEEAGGRILAEFVEGEQRTLTAIAPLAGLFGYPRRLHETSGGRARVVMRFKGYEPVSMALGDEFEDDASARDFGGARLLAAGAVDTPPANDG